jgi:hypothetical protein
MMAAMGSGKAKGGRGGRRAGAGRKPDLKEPVSVTLWVEKADLERVQAEAERRAVSSAAVIREGLRAYLFKRKG